MAPSWELGFGLRTRESDAYKLAFLESKFDGKLGRILEAGPWAKRSRRPTNRPMDNEILSFLGQHGVCSLTTLLPDGSPHAAALHFSFKANPLELYFLTKNTSRKTKGLLRGEKVPGAVVVGFSDEELITLQMDGEIVAVTGDSKLHDMEKVHYNKHPDSRKYKDDPTYIFLEFTPGWWRYTDYNTKPVTILSSEEIR